MATHTGIHFAVTGGTYRAFPASEADFTNWATRKVTLAESGSTGKYSGSLDDTYGYSWLVFASDSTPTSFTQAVAQIDLYGSELLKVPRSAAALTAGAATRRNKVAATSSTLDETLEATP